MQHRGIGDRVFMALLQHRWLALAAVVAFSIPLMLAGARVRPDYSIEMAFPSHHESRVNYERYRRDFPLDDATALVVVEAPDLFTPAGLKRLAALEADLGRIEGVIDTQGLTTVRDIESDGFTIYTDLLVPSPDLEPAALAEVRRTATTEPLFVWTLARPDGQATTIQVTLSPDDASSEATRTRFFLRAREVVRRHDEAARLAGVDQRLTLSGLPVIRSQFTELINTDLGRLGPVALVLTLLLLYVSLRSLVDVGAAFATIAATVVWLLGVMGLWGVPLQVLTQISPIIVMIVSVSDTSHIVADFRERLFAGADGRSALAAACAAGATPCLLTELTIAGGFVGLAFNDMVMIQQFGLVTAAGAMLAWLANMTVLPLALSFLGADRGRARRQAGRPTRRAMDRLVAVVERMVLSRAGLIVGVAAASVLVSLLLASRVGREYYSYDDLRPSGSLYQDLRRVEGAFGGSVPLAVFVEPAAGTREPDGMLEPEALALIDRVTRRLRARYPDEIRNVRSLTDYLGKAHRLFTDDDPRAGDLPASRRLAVQELTAVEEPRVLRHLLSADRSTAAIVATVPDRGSSRASEIIADLRAYFDDEEAAHPYRLTLTGIYGVADGIYQSLVGGLVRSFGWAVLVSFAMFGLVLRSLRLALIALVPNLLPLVLMLGMMSALGIDIKPTTVIIFSIVLVIADDDTIQYLARFRRQYAEAVRGALPSPHREAALETLRRTGPPMLVTTASVAIGFSVLLFSEFLGLANLGLLTALALLAAFLADVFLAPLLLIRLRPRIRVSRDGGSTPDRR